MTTVSISALTQLALVYVPFLQAIFQTAALSRRDLGVIVLLAGTSFTLHELRRGWERRKESEGGYVSVAQDELV